jgi:hypothetical protein
LTCRKKSPAAADDNKAVVNPAKGLLRKDSAMASKEFFEQAATTIGTLDRNELKRKIKNFKGRFRLDFTDDYLEKLPVDRLRHVLFAALINNKRS